MYENKMLQICAPRTVCNDVTARRTAHKDTHVNNGNKK